MNITPAYTAWGTHPGPPVTVDKARAAALTVCEHNTADDARIVLDRLGLTAILRGEQA